jgi:hypothetical protein
VSQPEESQEKTPKTDDILLKPILKDIDDLKKLENPDLQDKRRQPPRKRDRSNKGT